jgi:signal transduction histidine kinase
VYEGEREVATVGILTDLRERIRMEQRLLDAQQKLQLSEKQALVAELAGAAAHELNQPLTSIMGYAQLIQRQAPPSAVDSDRPPHLRAVSVILAEAERMAGIVKKIGKITKYETTDYVGSARIFDLDRAAADSMDAIPAQIESGEDSKTGEFSAVSAPPEVGAELENSPTNADLGELADRSGGKG